MFVEFLSPFGWHEDVTQTLKVNDNERNIRVGHAGMGSPGFIDTPYPRQGESGPDPEELPAAQVLGHGLRLVFGGLRRRGQRHCLQELELATWVATCGL